MLKIRVVGVVLVRSGIAVQSVGFRRFLPLGRPEIAIEYLDRWGIDEIVLLHIDATRGAPRAGAAEVASYARCCRVPLSIGGGIVDVADVREIIHAGADKVVVNSALVTAPHVVTAAAELFGSQCVVASIDARRQADGRYMTYVGGGQVPTGLSVSELAAGAERLGAGEVLITSIDRDGSKRGYDLDLIRQTVDAVRIPVIACGGVGEPSHLLHGARARAAAVAAGNFFHFTEHSVILAKRVLKTEGTAVRLDSYATYGALRLDARGRVAKPDESMLESLRFQYIPEEVI
jgi:cyclase